jgi:hypothetical protein
MYQCNGVDFLIQPTSGRWLPRMVLDVTGDGHPVYGAERQFELRWNLSDPSLPDQLRQWFEATIITGTCSVALPYYATGSWSFYTYPNCILYEPERGTYFNEDVTDVVMVVGNIR